MSTEYNDRAKIASVTCIEFGAEVHERNNSESALDYALRNGPAGLFINRVLAP